MIDSDFRKSLTVLGLGQYHDKLVAEAFDSWSVLAEITESDLDALNVRLGHRRILQRAITAYQQSPAASGRERIEEHYTAPTQPYSPNFSAADDGQKAHRVKRKYVRHPKDDSNAPAQAPTGYVLFSNWVREGLRDQKYDFPETAKIVGRKWQALPKDEKDIFLNKAKELKTRYLRQMADYKRTPEYREYQRYLTEFRAKNASAPRTYKQSNGVDDEQMSNESQYDSPRSRSISMSGEHSTAESGFPDMAQARLPLTTSPTVLEPALPPNLGHAHYGNRARLPASAAYQPISPDADRSRQASMHNLSSRQLPPLMQSFRS